MLCVLILLIVCYLVVNKDEYITQYVTSSITAYARSSDTGKISVYMKTLRKKTDGNQKCLRELTSIGGLEVQFIQGQLTSFTLFDLYHGFAVREQQLTS